MVTPAQDQIPGDKDGHTLNLGDTRKIDQIFQAYHEKQVQAPWAISSWAFRMRGVKLATMALTVKRLFIYS